MYIKRKNCDLEQEENTFVQASLWNFHRSIEWLGICSSGVSVDNVPLMSITTTLRLPFRPCLYLIITWTLEFIWWRVDKAVEPVQSAQDYQKDAIYRTMLVLRSADINVFFHQPLWNLSFPPFYSHYSFLPPPLSLKMMPSFQDIELRCQKLFNRKFCENRC